MLSESPLPPPDHLEPNDDAGPWSHALPPLPRTVDASLDYWDDNIDVYRVHLKKGAQLFARLTPGSAAQVRLALWAPGTQHVEITPGRKAADTRVAQGRRAGTQVRLSYRAAATGIYYLEAKLVAPVRDPVQYKLGLSRR
jgi:hypothetical protein